MNNWGKGSENDIGWGSAHATKHHELDVKVFFEDLQAGKLSTSQIEALEKYILNNGLDVKTPKIQKL